MLQIKQKNAGSRAEWLVDSSYTFGSGTETNYKVGKAAHEATLNVDGDKLTLMNISGSDEVQANGSPVKGQVLLGADDEFTVGEAIFELIDPKALRAKTAPAAQGEASDTSGWSLKALNTALANKSFPLEASQSIGRANDCDICLNVVHLSRRHAQIAVKDGYLQVNDLNSSNGTFLNGKKISNARVRSGDELAFDTLKFQVNGPFSEVEKTSLRMTPADADGDQTSMRSALSEDVLKAMKAKKDAASAAKPAAEKVKASSTAPVPPKPTQSQQSSGTDASTKFMILAVSLIVVAAAAYFIFIG